MSDHENNEKSLDEMSFEELQLEVEKKLKSAGFSDEEIQQLKSISIKVPE